MSVKNIGENFFCEIAIIFDRSKMCSQLTSQLSQLTSLPTLELLSPLNTSFHNVLMNTTHVIFSIILELDARTKRVWSQYIICPLIL